MAPVAPTTRTRMIFVVPSMAAGCHTGRRCRVTLTDTAEGGNVTGGQNDGNRAAEPRQAGRGARRAGEPGQPAEAGEPDRESADWLAGRFEQHRGRLRAVAYRML